MQDETKHLYNHAGKNKRKKKLLTKLVATFPELCLTKPNTTPAKEVKSNSNSCITRV